MGTASCQWFWGVRVFASSCWPKGQSRIVVTAFLAVCCLIQPGFVSSGADFTGAVHTPTRHVSRAPTAIIDAGNSTRRRLIDNEENAESQGDDTCELEGDVTHYVRIIVFGKLGEKNAETASETPSEDDVQEGMTEAARWIFLTFMKSMFYKAEPDVTLARKPGMEYYYVNAYELDPKSDDDDRPSPYNRTVFSYNMSGDPPCSVRRRSMRLCSDYASPEQELLYGFHRALGMAGKYPREALDAIGHKRADIGSSLLLVSYLQYTGESDPIENTGCNFNLNAGFGSTGSKGSRLQIPECPDFASTCRESPELCEGDEQAAPWQCKCDYGYSATPAIQLQLDSLTWKGMCIPVKGYCPSQLENGRPVMLDEAETAHGVPLEVAMPKCEDGALGKRVTCTRETRERGAWLPAEDGCGEQDADSDDQDKPCVFRSRQTAATSEDCVAVTSPSRGEHSKRPDHLAIVKGTPLQISTEGGGNSPDKDSTPPVRFKVVDAQTALPIPGAVVDIFEDSKFTKLLGSVPITSRAVRVYTDLAVVYATARKEGYKSSSMALDRRYGCGGRLSDCFVQFPLSQSIDGEQVESDDCALEVDPKNAASELQMRVVLSWSPQVPDLDIWVRNAGCSEDTRRQAGLPTMDDPLEEVLDERELNERLAPQMDEKVSFAEAQACGMSIVYKHKDSGRSVMRQGKPRCLLAKQAGLEGCRSRQARSKNQFPKWLFWNVRYMDFLHKRLDGQCSKEEGCTTIPHKGGEGWDDNSFVVLDVDARNGNGPETVTFYGPPPGTYQIVVEKYKKNDGFGDIRDARPRVDLYLGSNIHLTCRIDSSCATPNHTIWNVANIVVTNTGPELDASGKPTGRQRISLKVLDDDRVAPLSRLDVPTMESRSTQGTGFQTSPNYNVYSDETLGEACVGMCEAATGDTQSGKCLVRPRQTWASR